MVISEPSDKQRRKQKIAGIFSRAAPTYDRVGPRIFTHFGQRLVDLAKIPNGAKVLDVATGRGAVLFPAAQVVGPHGHVNGIDLSEAMVRETSEEVNRLKLLNVDIRIMDAEDLHFSDGMFDFILCGYALFFFPELEKALAELHRVLKPHGCIAVSTWDREEDKQWEWYDALVNAFLPSEDEEQHPSDPKAPPEPVLDKPEGLEAIIMTAGFTDVQVFTETLETIYTCEEDWWSTLWSHGSRASLEKIEETLGPDGLEKFRLAVFERLQSIKQADGIHQWWTSIFALARKPDA